MKFSKRRLWIIAIVAISVIGLFTLILAPTRNPLNSGSSYLRAPDGYGAWYAFISQQGIPIQRWKKPLETAQPPSGGTLIRVYSQLREASLSSSELNWVKQGNTLILLGVNQPVTKAAFSTQQSSPEGTIFIDTRRRKNTVETELLTDQYGAIVWKNELENGQVIFAVTPYLGANAYQDSPGNYQFLAKLASPNRQPIWMDEYIHGYKDQDIIQQEQKASLVEYLQQTPLFPLLIQVIIILIIVIWAGNRRFGKPLIVTTPPVDNSTAYIQALAGVLHKAGSTEFILEVIGKEERLKLQQELGLGQTPVDDQTLIEVWVQQTGRSSDLLKQVLKTQTTHRRVSETQILKWLDQWKTIHPHET